MIFLSIIILLFTEDFEIPKINYYLSNCNHKGLIEELEKDDYLNSGFGWLLYIYYLKAGDFKKLEQITEKPNLKKVIDKKRYEVELLDIFYKEKDYSKVIDYMKNYLKKEGEIKSYKKIGSHGWVAVSISCIIKNEKDLLDYFINEKIKRGLPYALAYYYLYKKLPKDVKEEDFGHPDKKAFVSYMENKIKKEELIEKIKECYKDLPVWLDINIEMIKALP